MPINSFLYIETNQLCSNEVVIDDLVVSKFPPLNGLHLSLFLDYDIIISNRGIS